jgi:hypothetical protein
MNALQTIQQKLKAPKSSYNSFGKYSYRNQEDILEAVKPLLAETKSVLTITDEVVEIGGSLFVKATAILTTDSTPAGVAGYIQSVTAYAMHAKDQKGMNEAQITGAASSYARKYALNGLFLIDDTKDADATNDGSKAEKKAAKAAEPAPVKSKPDETPKPTAWLNTGTKDWEYVVKKIKDSKDTPSPVTIETIQKTFRLSKENLKKLQEETK